MGKKRKGGGGERGKKKRKSGGGGEVSKIEGGAREERRCSLTESLKSSLLLGISNDY